MNEPLHDITLTVNQVPYAVSVPARRLLSDAIRHDIGLTGTHVGCEHGVCGACTVLLDGAATRSCLVFAVSADGAEITTTEGCLRADGELGPVQQAFRECHALQCGFCTPGQIVSAVSLVDSNPSPTDEEIRHAMAGNLCRCGAYPKIEEAIRTWRG